MDFRYAQFCPLTRAAEILGERWTILILRELFLGPKRFSDLKSALNGVSPSVLAERLARLEERGIVRRRELPPPAASAVYELDEAGRAVQPVLVELTRWGLRFIGTPDAADTFRPEWLLLGFQVFARTHDAPQVAACLHIDGDDEAVDITVRGDAGSTSVSRGVLPHDVSVSAPPMEMLMFTSGLLQPDAGGSALRYEGDIDAVRRIPALFDFSPPAAPEPQFPTTSLAAPAARTVADMAAAGSPRPSGARGARKTPAAKSGRAGSAADSGRLKGAKRP